MIPTRENPILVTSRRMSNPGYDENATLLAHTGRAEDDLRDDLGCHVPAGAGEEGADLAEAALLFRADPDLLPCALLRVQAIHRHSES